MNNGLLIALAIIFVVILLAINIYLLALYVHSDDKGFGTALYCKVLVVLGLTLCQAQALMVPLDVANVSALDTNGIDMKGFWYFVYLTVLIFICLLLPFALFFYETDEEDSFCRRVVKGIIYTLLANIVSILLLFITWNFFKFVQLPVHAITSSGSPTMPAADMNNWTISQSDSDVTLEL
jgi:LMBR1 domain-containing protein 1